MQEVLRAKYTRKVFLVSTSLSIIILILISYLVIPDNVQNEAWKKFLTDLCNGISFSLISTIFIGLFIYYFTPEIKTTPQIEVAEARQLGELFEEAVLAR